MDMFSKYACLVSAAMGLSALAVQAQGPVSIESLLTEMIDRDAVARFPEKDFPPQTAQQL